MLRAGTRLDNLVPTMPDQIVAAPLVDAAPPRVEELWLTADYQDRWRELLACLDPHSGEKVLDVGFGRGEALRYLAQRLGRSGRAVGVGPGAAHAAGLRAQTTAELVPPVAVAGVAQTLPLRSGAFDAALCVNVLEALPAAERRGALEELRRVLKVGGRAVVAHDDWESLAYAGADRELTRRCVRAYADVRLRSYAASDGQMGRHLLGLFRAAGFRDAELRVLPLVNTEYREPLFGWVHSRVPVDLLPAASGSAVTQDEVARWHAQLAAASARGEYAFSATLYVCLGSK